MCEFGNFAVNKIFAIFSIPRFEASKTFEIFPESVAKPRQNYEFDIFYLQFTLDFTFYWRSR